MATAARLGDVLIRGFAGSSFQLLDAVTHEQIAIVPSIDEALTMAAQRGAAWQENADTRGHRTRPPALLLPKGSEQVQTRDALRLHRTTATTDQVQHLKALHEEWAIQLHQVVAADTEQALHLAEALDDLNALIESTLPRRTLDLDYFPVKK